MFDGIGFFGLAWNTVHALALSTLLMAFACATPGERRVSVSDGDPHSTGSEVQQPKAIWTLEGKGLISDLDVNSRSGRILVGTLSDSESPGSFRGALLLSPNGEVVLNRALEFPVRQQSLSPSGDRIVVSDYENQVISFGLGKASTWTVSGHCRPSFIGDSGLILCLHDDDPVTDVPFEILSTQGKRVYLPDYHADALTVRMSSDGKLFAVLLRGGGVALYGVKSRSSKGSQVHDVELYWRKTFKGEVVDLAFAEPTIGTLRLGVYVHSEGGERRVHFLDLQGQAVAPSLELKGIAPSQIGFQKYEGSGQIVLFAYSNGPRGQWLHSFRLRTQASDGTGRTVPGWEQEWKYGDEGPAEFSSRLLPLPQGGVLVGMEVDQGPGRLSQLIALSREGQESWRIKVESEGPAYIFQYALSAEDSVLYLATDDGRLTAYRLPQVEEARGRN